MNTYSTEQLRIRKNEKRLRDREDMQGRIWFCVCNAVLGVFAEDYKSLDIQAKRVDVTVSGGSIERICAKCGRTGHIRTRSRNETAEEWLQDHKIQLAIKRR